MRIIWSCAALALLAPAFAAEPAKKEAPAAPKLTDDWKDDPVCRMVFFAVLEGLYTDGVSSEAADRVVGRKAKDGPADLVAKAKEIWPEIETAKKAIISGAVKVPFNTTL